MNSRPGRIGRIISDIIPDRILFGYKSLSRWYESNPYRMFDGNDDDRRGTMLKDILVLKNQDSVFANAKPVIVVDGSSTSTRNNKTIYQYNVTLYFDSNNSRISVLQTLPKSTLEKNYKRFATIKDLSKETLSNILNSAIQYYNPSNTPLEKKLSIQDIHYLVQNYANYLF